MNKNHFRQEYEQLMVLTTLITLLVSNRSTDRKYSVWEETVPPMAGPPLHSHLDEEVFYVLSGEFEFTVGDPAKPIKATAGDAFHMPSNVVHTYKNVGNTAGKLLTMAPGYLEDYFRVVGQNVQSANDIPDLDAVPDFANLDIANFLAQAPNYQVAFHLPEKTS